jgi:3',5'-nucleoside bisphosphate phosphatase
MLVPSSHHPRCLAILLLISLTSGCAVPAMLQAQQQKDREKNSVGQGPQQPPWPTVMDHRAVSREEIHFPAIGDYLVLKGDFHCHTIYSDGQVTPEVRVWEAWRDGLDILNLTDHPEYMDTAFPADSGRSFGRVKALAKELGLVLIHSAELTTTHSASPPFSDFIVSFIQDERKMKGDFYSAIRAAREQGAAVIWAHPGDQWTQEARRLLEQGWLDGIEIRNAETAGSAGTSIKNGTSFYPQVMDWCLRNNLGLFASSDAHWPIDHYFNFPKGDRRDMTLVLAATRDDAGIKEAIKQRRTIGYFGEMLWGPERWLKAVSEAALRFKNIALIRPTERVFAIAVENQSSFPFKVQFSANTDEVWFRPVVLKLASRSTTLVPFTSKGPNQRVSPLKVTLTLTNVFAGTNRPLELTKEIN